MSDYEIPQDDMKAHQEAEEDFEKAQVNLMRIRAKIQQDAQDFSKKARAQPRRPQKPPAPTVQDRVNVALTAIEMFMRNGIQPIELQDEEGGWDDEYEDRRWAMEMRNLDPYEQATYEACHYTIYKFLIPGFVDPPPTPPEEIVVEATSPKP